MHTAYYTYQVSQFVSIHLPDSDVVQYGTIKQVNCTIYLNNAGTVVDEVEYLVELYGAGQCPKVITATENQLHPSPMPIGG